MKWTPGYRSNNVDDRRGERGQAAGIGGGAIGILFLLFRKFGIVGVLVGGAALYFFSSMGSGSSSLSGQPDTATDSTEQPTVEFVSFVLDDAQATWTELFKAAGKQYQPARLEIFRTSISSACGLGQAAMGPFYCPGDKQVYIDLSFYDELKQRFGAPGDFAQAYVITHEIGHHVQHLLGLDKNVQRGDSAGANGSSVRLELQADCFSGVWAHSSNQRQLLEAGDVEEALKAAAVIGDDALQKQAGGGVRPESFTHGSSAQRARWFKRGFESGDMASCDTFAAAQL